MVVLDHRGQRAFVCGKHADLDRLLGNMLQLIRHEEMADRGYVSTAQFERLNNCGLQLGVAELAAHADHQSISKELLASPMRLAINNDAPRQWPAWNMDFDQEQAAPRAFIGGTAKARIVENCPARIAIEVTREGEGSKFAQTVRLSAGDAGNRVEFGESIDWRSLSANVKAVFPLASANKLATYNWEVGTIQRPAAFDRQFEVASHH